MDSDEKPLGSDTVIRKTVEKVLGNKQFKGKARWRTLIVVVTSLLGAPGVVTYFQVDKENKDSTAEHSSILQQQVVVLSGEVRELKREAEAIKELDIKLNRVVARQRKVEKKGLNIRDFRKLRTFCSNEGVGLHEIDRRDWRMFIWDIKMDRE